MAPKTFSYGRLNRLTSSAYCKTVSVSRSRSAGRYRRSHREGTSQNIAAAPAAPREAPGCGVSPFDRKAGGKVMDPKVSKLASLLGSASLLAMAASSVSQAQQMAQAQMAEVPEQVLITGSLIRGTVAVGVPVTNIGHQDFIQTGALTTADLFKTIPAFVVTPGAVGT